MLNSKKLSKEDSLKDKYAINVEKDPMAISTNMAHSALDLDEDIYYFTQWYHTHGNTLFKQISWEDYTLENGMGYGFMSNQIIKDGQLILRMPTFNCISTGDYRKPREDDELGLRITKIIEEASLKINKGHPANHNRHMDHLCLVLQMVGVSRSKEDKDYEPWHKVLPQEDLSNMSLWDKSVLAEMDSENIKEYFEVSGSLITYYYHALKEIEGLERIDRETFFWAYNIVSSRHIILHNDNTSLQTDPEHRNVVAPMFDFVNHSSDPNVQMEVEYEDIKDGTIEFLSLKAVKDIDIGDQLCINYGNYSNLDFCTKYGFTIKNNSDNFTFIKMKFNDKESILMECYKVKQELLQKFGLNPQIMTQKIYSSKFDQDLLMTFRIMFLTAAQISQIGKANLTKELFKG